MKRFFFSVFVMMFLMFVGGCSVEETPNGQDCITSFDCGEGYTCEENKCVELSDPDADKPLTDKDAAPVEKDSALPDEVIDEPSGDHDVPFGDDMTDDALEVGDDGLAGDADNVKDELVSDSDGPVGSDTQVDIQPDVDTVGDVTPPTVLSNNPSDNASGVGVATTISATFNEPMNAATITTATIQVKQGASTVPGTVGYTAGTYTAVFTPSASLSYATTYDITVTTGVEDLAGNGLASAHEFSFTTAAEEINECLTNYGGCRTGGDTLATCTDIVGGYTCNCTTPAFVAGGGTCQDANECLSNNGGCDTLTACTNTVGGRTCSACPAGYSGTGTTGCTDINECTTLFNPCDNNDDAGGACHNTSGSYYCTCSTGFTATGGACIDNNECTPPHPCDDNGDTGASCQNLPGSYDCTCSSGFSKLGGTCNDIDECTLHTDGCAQNCQNTLGSHTCSCNSGYTLNADGHTCDNINECATNYGGCRTGGDTTATCTDATPGYTCNCNSGFTASGGTCTDVNECTLDTDGCAQNCQNTTGSHTCSCNSGYTLNANGHACDDIDECTVNSNPCNDHGDTTATCTNTTGSYTCTCSIWYDFTLGGCRDIDECTKGTDNCHTNANCANTTGGFTCACKPYYSGDGTVSCTFCNTDGQCGSACAACGGGTAHCKDNGNNTSQCVACTQEDHCSGGTPHCLLSNNTCVQCRDNADCTVANEVCNTVTHVCAVNVCGDGVPGGTAAPAFTETFEGGFPAYGQSYGNSDWAVSTGDKHAGSYSLKSGTLYWEDTYTAVLMNKYSDGQICFWYKGTDMYSAEFDVSVDGSSKWYTTSDQSSWAQKCITVTAGYRLLEFRLTYSTDYSDGVWYVDDITFHNAIAEQCDGGSTSCTVLGFQCGDGVTCGSDCTWGAGEAQCHNEDSCGDC
ncbi:MAG TPA: Ig-like domain-containing protein [bacterium]|nr:Ig-like domain-containing protein [bacterium]